MIIGITGKKRSGKDTVATYLANNFGLFSRQIASPLKQALSMLYGWPMEWMEDGPEKEKVDPEFGISPREAMQFMGAEFNKHLSAKYPEYEKKTGTKLYMKRMMSYCEMNKGMNFVISDLRMPFTAEAIKATGGFIIRVERPGTDSSDGHDTEKYIDQIEADVVIHNDSTLDDLYLVVDAIADCDNDIGRALRHMRDQNTKA